MSEARIGNARQAELAVVDWLHGLGYTDAAPAVDGPEGVDVVAHSGLAVVRYGHAAVRRRDLQQLAAAGQGRSDLALFVFASSRFELPALTYADGVGIVLLTYDETGRMTPSSAAARVLLQGRGAGVAAPAGTAGGSWLPVLRHAPLAVALYFLVVAVLQAAAFVRGEDTAAAAAFALALAIALAAAWFFLTRRLRLPTADDGARPPRRGRGA